MSAGKPSTYPDHDRGCSGNAWQGDGLWGLQVSARQRLDSVPKKTGDTSLNGLLLCDMQLWIIPSCLSVAAAYCFNSVLFILFYFYISRIESNDMKHKKILFRKSLTCVIISFFWTIASCLWQLTASCSSFIAQWSLWTLVKWCTTKRMIVQSWYNESPHEQRHHKRCTVLHLYRYKLATMLVWVAKIIW